LDEFFQEEYAPEKPRNKSTNKAKDRARSITRTERSTYRVPDNELSETGENILTHATVATSTITETDQQD